MADNDDNPWYRSLLAGIGALLGVAVLVGGVVSLVTLGAVNVSGIGDTSSSPAAEQTLYIPKHSDRSHDPRDKGLTLDDINGGRRSQASESASPSPSPSPTERKKSKKPSVISLSASPVKVSPMEQIYLSGTYPGGEGATLQVQRLESGSWNNFPTSASVSGGTFSTYVMTGQEGDNKFRVVDTESGKKSNEVNVTVG